MTGTDLIDREAAWRAIAARPEHRPQRNTDPSTPLATPLPAPAVRLLDRAVPTGPVPIGATELTMVGEIKLGRWFPFRAGQILHPVEGFVWNASVGRWWLRFRGGDSYWRGHGSLEFKLAGLLPVVRATGADIDRSAAGRHAIETVVWAPNALLPSAGASWQPIDDTRATVSRDVDGERYDVTVTVDDRGMLRDVRTMRWGNPDGGEFGPCIFGGSVSEVGTFGGLTIATAGTVGWWRGTDREAEGEFFRYRILDARPAAPAG